MKKLKNIKRIKQPKISPYYSHLLRFASWLTLFIVAMTVIGGILDCVYYGSRPNGIENFYGLASLLAPLITIGGGFGISYLLSRNANVTRAERIVKAGTFGLIASFVYSVTFGLLLLLDFSTKPGVATWLTSLGPLLALIITTVAVIIDRRSSTFLRDAMALFIVVFWGAQLWDAAQAAQFVIAAPWNNSWWDVPLTIGIPLVVSAIFYAVLQRIGRIARVFYATYFTGLLYTFSLASFSFLHGPASYNLSTIASFATLSVLAVIFGTLFTLRRRQK